MRAHYRDLRLANNAGISLPVCKANEPLLDLDASHWRMTMTSSAVTCRACIAAWARDYDWAGPIGPQNGGK